MLTQYNNENNVHVFSLGIELSKNHPMLYNVDIVNEMKEKSKCNYVSAIPK